MPVYNGERFITQAIESIVAQCFTDWELVIVNDGSTDASEKRIDAFRTLPNIRYEYQKNKGIAAALNRCIVLSSGEFIALLDQDDVHLPQKLDLQVSFMRDHPDVALAHGNIKLIDEEGNELTPTVPYVTDASGYCFGTLFMGNRIAAPTVMLRRSCLDISGLFDESISYGVDYDLWLRVAHNFPIGYINQTLAQYRKHASNMSASRNAIPHNEGILSVLRKTLQQFPDSLSVVGEDGVTGRLRSLEAYIEGLRGQTAP